MTSREHEENGEVWVDIRALDEYLEGKLARIRLGVYSEEQDGSVQEILEEIERILR